MQFTKLGSKNQLIKLNKWKDGKDSVWNFMVDEIKLNQQLLYQKRKIDVKLDEEVHRYVKKSLNFKKQFSTKTDTQEMLCLRSAGNSSITEKNK